MKTRHDWQLPPTVRQLAALKRLANDLGYIVPAPATRDQARRLMLGYEMEKRKREGKLQ